MGAGSPDRAVQVIGVPEKENREDVSFVLNSPDCSGRKERPSVSAREQFPAAQRCTGYAVLPPGGSILGNHPYGKAAYMPPAPGPGLPGPGNRQGPFRLCGRNGAAPKARQPRLKKKRDKRMPGLRRHGCVCCGNGANQKQQNADGLYRIGSRIPIANVTGGTGPETVRCRSEDGPCQIPPESV